MAKRPTVLVTLLTVLIFITGCPQAELVFDPEAKTRREHIEPNHKEMPHVQIRKPEPNEPPTKSGAAKIEPKEEKPPTFQPDEIEPNEAVFSVTEPNKAEVTTIKLINAEPNAVEFVGRVTFHDKCASILSSFVDEDGLVDYSTLRRKRLELKKLLNEFDELNPNEYNAWTKEDKIAFWINTYNIQMLNIIVDNYPIESSRILSLFWGPYSIRHIKGIWTDYKFMVMDEEFTLREIQQRFFRQEFDELRVYFALSYASLSSPSLRNEPYYGYKLHEQLESQTERFLSSPSTFKIDREKKIAYLSAIFQSTWYGKDFINKYDTDKKFKDQQPVTRAVLNFITNYIRKQDIDFLEVENYSVEYIKYDWTLNDSSIK